MKILPVCDFQPESKLKLIICYMVKILIRTCTLLDLKKHNTDFKETIVTKNERGS